MKHIKIYEIYIDAINKEENSELLLAYRYKIGDHVKMNNPLATIIMQIVAINTEDDYQPYQIENKNNKYWVSGKKLKLVPEEEYIANKYNI